MKNSILYILFMVIIGCSSTKEIQSKEVVYYGKTACLGKCSVLDVFIYDDGTVLYNGIKNVAKKGKLTFKISETELKELKDEIMKIDFTIDSNQKFKRDLPKTILKFNGKKKMFQNLKKIEKFERLLKRLLSRY